MHQPYGHYHIYGDSESCDAAEQPEKKSNTPQKFRQDREQGKECWNPHAVHEGLHGLVETGSAKPTEDLLSTVHEKKSTEDHARESQHIIVARVQDLSKPHTHSCA